MTNDCRTLTILAMLGVLLLASRATLSAETVYGNLNEPARGGGGWWNFDDQVFSAQPFQLGNHDMVESATLKLKRDGRPDGMLILDLYDDNSGVPGSRVGNLGTVDPLSLAHGESTVTFDAPVLGLVPHESYHLVFRHNGKNWGDPGRRVFWSLTRTPGQDGVGQALAVDPLFDVPDWHTIHRWPGGGPPFPVWFYANVEAILSEQTLKILQAGDADQDSDFDQLDLVQVQVAARYLTGQPATWGEGDWDGAPGGSPGDPPAGDGLFNQYDIIAAQQANTYLTGPYTAIQGNGSVGDGQTSVIYNAGTGELLVDTPSHVELTSINIDSAAGIFTGQAAANLGGSFDNDVDDNIFKATFGGSFGSISFGKVTQAGLTEEFLLGDLNVVGSLAGGGDLGVVDLVYVPEPTSVLLLSIGLVIGVIRFGRKNQ